MNLYALSLNVRHTWIVCMSVSMLDLHELCNSATYESLVVKGQTLPEVRIRDISISISVPTISSELTVIY